MNRFWVRKKRQFRKDLRKLKARLTGCRLAWRNHRSCLPITRPDGEVIISLTTYGKRAQKAHLCIESIAAGSALPHSIILWLDEEALLNNLPKGLKRLQARGLEIRRCENLRSFKKFYPALEAGLLDRPLITADDDILYPKKWLEGLLNAHHEHPDEIIAYRAHRIVLDGNTIAPYKKWQSAYADQASLLHFATGVNGVLYPPRFLRFLKNQGRGFLACCPNADDIWLHACALKADVFIRQVGSGEAFLEIAGSQENALYRTNIQQGENDRQIAQTYSTDLIAKLQASPHPKAPELDSLA